MILVGTFVLPVQAAENTGASTVAPQGKETWLEDGTNILADGTVVFPNGTKMLPNGDVVYPDGTKMLRNGDIMYRNGTILKARTE